MRSRFSHTVALALLGLIAVAATTGIAKAASALEHACCPHEAPSGANDDAPCHGFLPLSCCNAAALPTTASTPEPPASLVALPAAPVVLPGFTDRALLPTHAAPAPRAAPYLRSVVLQL